MLQVSSSHARRSNLLAVVQRKDARLSDVHLSQLLSRYLFLCHFLILLNFTTLLFDNRGESRIFVAHYLYKRLVKVLRLFLCPETYLLLTAAKIIQIFVSSYIVYEILTTFNNLSFNFTVVLLEYHIPYSFLYIWFFFKIFHYKYFIFCIRCCCVESAGS